MLISLQYIRLMFEICYHRTGEGDINDVLIKTLAEAHANTNLKLDIVHEMLRKGVVTSNIFLLHTTRKHPH